MLVTASGTSCRRFIEHFRRGRYPGKKSIRMSVCATTYPLIACGAPGSQAWSAWLPPVSRPPSGSVRHGLPPQPPHGPGDRIRLACSTTSVGGDRVEEMVDCSSHNWYIYSNVLMSSDVLSCTRGYPRKAAIKRVSSEALVTAPRWTAIYPDGFCL